jgi:hypothetical protein
VNNMSDMKQLSNDTIQLQHEVRLASKKVDVVGVIQSKVKDNVESLRDAVVDYHSDVLKIDTASISEGREQLFDKYKALEDKHELVIGQLEQLTDKTDDIDKALSESRQQALDELDRQQVVTTVQMDNLSASVAEASQKLDDHIKHVDLSDIERGVIGVGEDVESFLSIVGESRKQMDNELTNINASLDDLSGKQKTVDELNILFHDTVKTLRETLKSIDDKVCQISPLYTGPSARDIEESFNKMASTDITHLMDELHSKYQQTTKEVVDIMQPSESDTIDDAEPIIVTLPDESPQESLVMKVDLDNNVEKPKKGFFARLFGGDK